MTRKQELRDLRRLLFSIVKLPNIIVEICGDDESAPKIAQTNVKILARAIP